MRSRMSLSSNDTMRRMGCNWDLNAVCRTAERLKWNGNGYKKKKKTSEEHFLMKESKTKIVCVCVCVFVAAYHTYVLCCGKFARKLSTVRSMVDWSCWRIINWEKFSRNFLLSAFDKQMNAFSGCSGYCLEWWLFSSFDATQWVGI